MANLDYRFMSDDSLNSGTSIETKSSAFVGQVPFSTVFSIDPLVADLRSAAEAGLEPAASLVPRVEAYLAENSELLGALHEPDLLKRHSDFLQLLTSPLFPSTRDPRFAAALIVPFEYRVVHATPTFRELFADNGDVIGGRVDLDVETLTYGKALSAYLHVLQTAYDLKIPFDGDLTFTTRHPETGLDVHYKVVPDHRFVEVRVTDELPRLTATQVRRLLADASDLSEWASAIPSSAFELYGTSVLRAYDITREKMVSLLYRDLAHEESLVSRSVLPDIEEHIRTLLQMPDVELGLAVIDGSEFFVLNEPEQPLVNTFFSRSRRYELSALEGSTFRTCLNGRCIRVVEDLSDSDNRSVIEKDMRRWGVRSMVTAPLFIGDESVGLLYLWSPQPASLSRLDIIRALELLPIFATAVKRVRDEMRSRVQRVIMGQYTAIHPTVEWRFREAAVKSIQKEERGGDVAVEPIIFKDLFPLFAATDIRASSDHRNEAIRQDLLDHLSLVEEVLIDARRLKPLAILQHLLARIERYRKSLGSSLSSSDEAAVRDFFQRDIEPVLKGLEGADVNLDDSIRRYHESSVTANGSLYRRSRAFEESVRAINDTVSEYLDDQQTEIQPHFPHYFERHQTDGIDFTMYVGQSLLENGRYDSGFVHALRLWQLMVMCGVALRARSLRPQLAVQLETTHLILVQNTPINIRYRFDETRFDVDGPHHVRFEIMKQRVEKAYVRSSKQRLTQPDRIAIVYSQDREAHEYFAYLRHLQETGFIADQIEALELDDLQGMKGLRALRVQVAPQTLQELPEIKPGDLRHIVTELNVSSA